MRTLVLSFIFLVITHKAPAFEVDNFTNRYKPLRDSRDSMNEEVNARMQKAAESANGLLDRAINRISKGANKCDKDALYEEVYDEVGGWVIGSLEDYAEDSDKIQKHGEGKDAIYYRDGQAMAGAGLMLKIFGTHSSINLDGNYIGTDKFGHFFDQGYEYYKEFKKESSFPAGVKRALNYGHDLEKGKYGMEATGVFSNGDLVANYSGFQFWLALADGANPYFKCAQGQWRMVRKFDFAAYVNSGWDEAINCSKFRGAAKAGVEKNQIALERKALKNGRNQRYICPVSYDQCKKLTKQYSQYLSSMISYDCSQAIGKDEPGLKYSAQVPSSNTRSGSRSATGKKTKGVR